MMPGSGSRVSRIDKRVTLPDGRKLGYDEHGPSDGKPLSYFHGTPRSRRKLRLFVGEELADSLNVRVIAPDRPGMGLSDFQAGLTIGYWPADVATLADALGLGRFAVLGYSGSGPYAPSCALKIPERLAAVGIVSSPAPYDVPGLTDAMDPNNLSFIRLACERPLLSRLARRDDDVALVAADLLLPGIDGAEVLVSHANAPHQSHGEHTQGRLRARS